ncbi:MAG: J domain-containing protein [Spirochaetia bacterium]
MCNEAALFISVRFLYNGKKRTVVDIFDRLGNLIRTILDDLPAGDNGGQALGAGMSLRGGSSYRDDPDMREAWEELENYMRERDPSAEDAADASFGSESTGVPESLRKDFRNLEVPFGAPFTDVRRSYKRLMTAFHPDRHSADQDRYRTATEVTKKLNQSLQRIQSHYETTG